MTKSMATWRWGQGVCALVCVGASLRLGYVAQGGGSGRAVLWSLHSGEPASYLRDIEGVLSGPQGRRHWFPLSHC